MVQESYLKKGTRSFTLKDPTLEYPTSSSPLSVWKQVVSPKKAISRFPDYLRGPLTFRVLPQPLPSTSHTRGFDTRWRGAVIFVESQMWNHVFVTPSYRRADSSFFGLVKLFFLFVHLYNVPSPRLSPLYYVKGNLSRIT